MKQEKKVFLLEGRYKDYFEGLGVDVDKILKKAKLPVDTFAREKPTMTIAEYFSFMEAFAELYDEEIVIRLSTSVGVKNFSPVIFAASCSPDGYTFLQRLSTYKRLICPADIRIEEDGEDARVTMSIIGSKIPMPSFLAQLEFAFILHILRTSTREHIVPKGITMQVMPKENVLADYAGKDIEPGDIYSMTFKKEELRLPFIEENAMMWEYLAPGLGEKLKEIQLDDSISTRVKKVLYEKLPSGISAIVDIANSLGVGVRTLQRELKSEDKSYNGVLAEARQDMLRAYVAQKELDAASIGFLLGYQETKSFLRAVKSWTGMGFREYRLRYRV